MGSPGGRRLRPLAVLCALFLVLWGIASAGSLIAQISELNDSGWPDENADGEIFAWILLYLSAAASGCWVGVWGLFGLAWRPPLHLGVLALVVAVGLEVAANVVQANYLGELDRTWSFADQLQWYGDRVTFQADALTDDQQTREFFVALPLVTAVVPFLGWLVVLFSGAGRKRRFAPQYGAPAYPPQQQYPQPQPYAPQPQYYAPQPQPYVPQQPVYRPPPVQQPPVQQPPVQQPPPAYRPPAEPERVAWRDVPPVLPRARPPAPPPDPPDQQETQPYPKPTEGS